MAMTNSHGPLRVGIGGPVGSGKTALVEAITPRLLELGIKVLIITPSGSPGSRPAVARTRRSVRMRPSISPRSTTW